MAQDLCGTQSRVPSCSAEVFNEVLDWVFGSENTKSAGLPLALEESAHPLALVAVILCGSPGCTFNAALWVTAYGNVGLYSPGARGFVLALALLVSQVNVDGPVSAGEITLQRKVLGFSVAQFRAPELGKGVNTVCAILDVLGLLRCLDFPGTRKSRYWYLVPVLPVFNTEILHCRLQEEKPMKSKIDSSLIYHECWKQNEVIEDTSGACQRWFMPNRGTKRPRDEEEEEIKARRKQASAREHSRHREEEAAALEETDDEKKKLLQIIERDGEEEEEEEEPLDESSVKKMILTFEKRSYKNQELRIKFPDNPEKFMESELDLNDIIQEMHVIATMPDLYHLLVELNAVQSLLGLLGHDNTDVSIAVVDLLQELTDIDTLHESEEGAEVLIDALVEGQVVALLVQNLERLDESVKEEADGVHNTLAIVENMAEFRPEMCTEAAQQGLMQWLLKRLKAKMPFDANKLYCSEVLAILLQNNDDNRELLGELDGIDVLLQQLSVFKRHNPSTAEEQEMMENLFDSLCSCLMLSSNRDRFLKGEGLQLMNLMLREKKISRSSALKVLDHAMIGPEGTDNCHKFVDILGLRTIFPLFMKSPKKIKKVGTTEKEHEEHVCSILASLLRNLRGQQRTRLLNKFTENDSEKVDRLMELYFKYLDAMQAADKKIDGEKHDMVRRGEIIDDDMEDEFYLRRLDAGLFVLQLICYIMAEICNANVPQIRQRVHQILNMRGSSIKIVRHILKEYAENIGDGKNQEFRESEQKRILDLLENF
ncbi:beta-catenin-like protein 1 [Athene cunicularia]|nr:beta-catenin-like protein 1 [Athene cunicularia]